MKKIVGLMLAVALLVLPIGFNKVYADMPSEFAYTVHNSMVTITGYTGGSKDIIIPEEIDGYPVTGIGNEAFRSKRLTSVIIPEGVISIGSSAFHSNALTSVTIPDSVTSISDRVFASNNIVDLVIPDGVTSIGDYAFSSNNLSNVTLSNNVTFIGTGAFFYNNLTSITLPSSLTSLSPSVFMSNKLTNVVIPDGVTSIGNGAFHSNELISVTIPDSVTTIEIDAFSINKLGNVTIPDSVTTIERDAFSYNKLVEVTIPNSVTSLANGVFSNNELTSITLPNNLTKIGHNAFSRNKLTNVTIPASVTSIDSYAFASNSLDTITFEGSLTSLDESVIASQTKQGYSFENWYGDETLQVAWDFTSSFNANTTLYSQYTPLTFTVSFNSNGGSLVVDITDINYDTTITAPVAPTKSGYVFGGWYADQELTIAWDFNTDKVTEDTTLYAQYTPLTYTVSFNSNGGSQVVDITDINYDTTITAPVTPTKLGYVFEGWYADQELTIAWDFNTDKVTENTTLYAQYTPLTYTVSFNSNGGSLVVDITDINYDTTITAPVAPTKSGYVFGGWYADQELKTAWIFNSDKVTEHKTLFAKWTLYSPPYVPPVVEQETEDTEDIESENEPEAPVENYFTDTDGHWAKNSINGLAQQGILLGYENGQYGPNDFIQRHHLVLLINRLIKFDAVREAVSFEDVPTNHPSYSTILNLQQGGVIDGYKNLFHPSGQLTLGELAKILVNAFHIEQANITEENQHWSYIYTRTLSELEIMKTEDIENGVNKPVTRALLADILYRLLQYKQQI